MTGVTDPERSNEQLVIPIPSVVEVEKEDDVVKHEDSDSFIEEVDDINDGGIMQLDELTQANDLYDDMPIFELRSPKTITSTTLIATSTSSDLNDDMPMFEARPPITTNTSTTTTIPTHTPSCAM